MAVQQTLKNVVLAKSGGAPAATECVTLNEPVLISPKVKSGQYSDVGTGAMGVTKVYTDPNFVTCDFSMKINARASSALGVAPKVGNLMKIAGLTETITASTKVEYKPGNNTGVGGGQVTVYNDGYKHVIVGAGANCKLTAKIGEPMQYEFATKGFTTPQATAEANPTVTLDASAMPIVSKITVLTIGGSSVPADSFELDFGNKIEEEYDIGLGYYYLSDFEPTIKVEAVKTIGTDEQAWIDYGNATPKAILIQVGTAGSMIELSIANAVVKDMDQKDDKGKVKISRTYACQAVAGNDNFTITYK